MKTLRILIDINFKFAVFLSIFGGFFVYHDPGYFISEDFLMYGPLGNNLLIVALIVSVMQILLLPFYYRGGYRAALAMGCLFLLMGYDLQTYAETNAIEIDVSLMYYCFYLGVSHIVYFLNSPDGG
jgi:hypothetical protein